MDYPIDLSGVCLETQRLILRPWRQADLDDLYSYASVEGVGEMAGWPHHQSREESQKIMDSFISEKMYSAPNASLLSGVHPHAPGSRKVRGIPSPLPLPPHFHATSLAVSEFHRSHLPGHRQPISLHFRHYLSYHCYFLHFLFHQFLSFV